MFFYDTWCLIKRNEMGWLNPQEYLLVGLNRSPRARRCELVEVEGVVPTTDFGLSWRAG